MSLIIIIILTSTRFCLAYTDEVGLDDDKSTHREAVEQYHKLPIDWSSAPSSETESEHPWQQPVAEETQSGCPWQPSACDVSTGSEQSKSATVQHKFTVGKSQDFSFCFPLCCHCYRHHRHHHL